MKIASVIICTKPSDHKTLPGETTQCLQPSGDPYYVVGAGVQSHQTTKYDN